MKIKSKKNKQIKMNFGPPPNVNRNLPMIGQGNNQLNYRMSEYNGLENQNNHHVNFNNPNRNIRMINGYDYVSQLKPFGNH
jgi:hypothetical protein